MAFVYILRDPAKQGFSDSVRYVGKTTKFTPEQRLRRHINDVKRSVHRHVCRWIFGLLRSGVSPTIEVFASAFTPPDACEIEREVIKQLRQIGCRLTNLTNGGDGMPGWNHSPEVREKIRLKHIGRHHSEEHRRKIAEGGRRRFSDPEARIRHSASSMGRVVSPETREKIRRAQIGKPRPAAGIAKMAESLRGRKLSREHKQAISLGGKRRYLNPEEKLKTSEQITRWWKNRKENQPSRLPA